MTLQDKSEYLLKNDFGPFFENHRLSRLLGQEKITFLPQMHRDVLQGERGTRFPLICLTTQRTMGPSRHVLSQMVVGGKMSIQPPFESKQTTHSYTNNSRLKFWRR
jgi:hypothetical protein